MTYRPISALFDIPASIHGRQYTEAELACLIPFSDQDPLLFRTADECEKWLETDPPYAERMRVFITTPPFTQAQIDQFAASMKEAAAKIRAGDMTGVYVVDSCPDIEEVLKQLESPDEAEDAPYEKFKPLPAHYQIKQRGGKPRRW